MTWSSKVSVMETVHAKCPFCKERIEVWFEQLHGMRVSRTEGRRTVYRAKCPKCNSVWDSDGRGRQAQMKEIRWERIVAKDRNDGSGANEGASDLALARRLYGLGGKQYPRMAIAVYGPGKFQTIEGFAIETYWKRREDSWWDANGVGVPPYLMSDLREMIDEAEGKWNGTIS